MTITVHCLCFNTLNQTEKKLLSLEIEGNRLTCISLFVFVFFLVQAVITLIISKNDVHGVHTSLKIMSQISLIILRRYGAGTNIKAKTFDIEMWRPWSGWLAQAFCAKFHESPSKRPGRYRVDMKEWSKAFFKSKVTTKE